MAADRPPREQRFERRMSDAEALMWNVEKDPWLNPNGGSLVILDRPPDIDHFRAQLASTVAAVPRLRERVVAGLGRFSPPVWRPDPEFELDYHIRQVALPAPGTERQLLDLVAAVYQDPYDRTRPLWIFYLIEGLEGGRAALMWKIHHAVADGMGASRLAESYMQRTPEPPSPVDVDLDAMIAEAVAADTEENGRASLAGTIVGTVTHGVRRQAGITRRALGEMAMWGADPLRARDAAAGVGRTIQQARKQLGGGASSSPDGERGGSPLWRNRSRHRHYEVIDYSLDDAMKAAKGLGGSLNDWFVTGAVNGAIAYHDERGVPLTSLNTSFIVSTRTDTAIGGNSFTPSRLSVPAGPMDPRERFREVGERMRGNRSEVSGQGMMASLAGVANLLPTSLVTGVARSQASRMDFATSNLRGAKTPWFISGAEVVETYPFGPVAGTAFNITTISYVGRLGIGLFIDPVAVEDPTGLRDHIVAAYDELVAIGTA